MFIIKPRDEYPVMLFVTKTRKHHNAHNSKIKQKSYFHMFLETPAFQVPFIVPTAHKVKIQKPYMLVVLGGINILLPV